MSNAPPRACGRRTRLEAGLIPLVIVGVLNSVISLFYYARIVKAMYLETVPEALANSPLFVKPTYYLLYAFLGFFTIYLGLSWGSWITFAGSSVSLMGSL